MAEENGTDANGRAMEEVQKSGSSLGEQHSEAASDLGAGKGETDRGEKEKKSFTPISYDGEEEPPKNPEALLGERLKHQKRAEKFGVEFVEPKKELVLSRAELRTEIARERAKGLFPAGFATGIDLFSEEEKAKRDLRAQKFGLSPEETGDAEAKARAEAEEKRRKRIERFGGTEAPGQAAGEGGVMETDVLEPRVDVEEGTALRPEALHLHGTDQLATHDIMAHFGAYGPSFVEWVNDSSCNVVFADAFSAKRALLGLASLERPPDATPPATGVGPAPWYRGTPARKGKGKGALRVPLSLRTACTRDVKPAAGVVSRNLWKTGDRRVPAGGRGGRGWDSAPGGGPFGRAAMESAAGGVQVDGEEGVVGGREGPEAAGEEPVVAGAEGDGRRQRRKRRRPEEGSPQGEAAMEEDLEEGEYVQAGGGGGRKRARAPEEGGATAGGLDLRDVLNRRGTAVEFGVAVGPTLKGAEPGVSRTGQTGAQDLREILTRKGAKAGGGRSLQVERRGGAEEANGDWPREEREMSVGGEWRAARGHSGQGRGYESKERRHWNNRSRSFGGRAADGSGSGGGERGSRGREAQVGLREVTEAKGNGAWADREGEGEEEAEEMRSSRRNRKRLERSSRAL